MIPQSVSPEGLRSRAQIMRDKGDESCARHLELAADELAELRRSAVKPRKGDPLDDPALSIARYRPDIDLPSKEMRIVFYGSENHVLGYLVVTAEEAYAMGSDILHRYDQLEGIAAND